MSENKSDVFPKDIPVFGWRMRLWLKLFGAPIKSSDGTVWAYSYKDSLYVVEDPADTCNR